MIRNNNNQCYLELNLHFAGVELITQGCSQFLADSSADGAVYCLFDLAGSTGDAQVILQDVAVHLQLQLKVRCNVVAANKSKTG